MNARRALILVGLLAAGAARAGQEIDLESAIDFALRQNRSLKLAVMNVEGRELSLENAQTAFAVELRPEGEAARTDTGDRLQYGLAASRKTTLGTSVEVQGGVARQREEGAADYHRGSARVQLTQPLLKQFGTLVNREPVTAAESRVVAARRELELRKTDIVVQVVEAYEDLFLLQRQEAFDRLTLARLDKLVRLTRARERQGRSSRVDLLRVELRFGEAQSRLNRLRERLSSARAEFADLLGFEPEMEFEVITADIPSIEIPPESAAVAIALENRLDYAQVLQDCRDAARGVRIARRNMLPDLNLITRYERYGDGETFSDGTAMDKDNWFVGLSVGSDLFRRSERVAKEQAVLNEMNALETAAILERALRRQVRQVSAAYQRARADLPLAERNYRLAESRAALARRLFEIGKGDNFSVTDAEDGLLDAQNRMLAAQSDAVTALYRLFRALGTLLAYPDDLKAPAAGGQERSRL